MATEARVTVVIDAENKIDSAMRSAEAAVDNFKGKLDNMQPAFQSLQRWGTVAFAAVGAAAFASVNSFQQFDAEIKRAGAFVNATSDELQDFREAAINAARGTKFSFQDTAVALQNFAGGEIDAATAAKELGSIVDLALVSKIDNLQEAVNIGSLALTVFKKDGMEMSDVIDIMATVAADVTTQTDRWSVALTNSAGAARTAGLSFKDLNVLFAQMVRGGADVNLIWSAFNSAITAIQDPGDKAAEALGSVGLNAVDLGNALREGPVQLLEYLRGGFEKAEQAGQGFAFLSAVLGRQAAPEFAAALTLTNAELEETQGWFEDISGSGATMVNKLRESQPATVVLGQALQELNLTIGQALSPALEQLTQFLLPIIQNISRWIAANPEITAGIVAFALSLAGTLAVLGTIGVVLPFIITGFGLLFSPITGLIALFGLAVAAGYQLATNWEFFAAKAVEIWETIKNAFKAAVDWIISNTIKPLMDWMDKVRSALETVASGVGKVVSGAGAAVGNVIHAVIPGRASGGPVLQGSPYVVGENGPELFVPSSSGSIIPNNRYANAGANVNITITGNNISSALDVRNLADQVGREVMRSLRLAQQV